MYVSLHIRLLQPTCLWLLYHHCPGELSTMVWGSWCMYTCGTSGLCIWRGTYTFPLLWWGRGWGSCCQWSPVSRSCRGGGVEPFPAPWSLSDCPTATQPGVGQVGENWTKWRFLEFYPPVIMISLVQWYLFKYVPPCETWWTATL